MKKRIGQFVIGLGVIFLCVFSGYASGNRWLPESSSYSTLKPFYKFVNYRPLTIYVYDQDSLEPIPDATVMIGEKENSPFQGNWMKTNGEGEVSFGGFLFPSDPMTITVRHPQYSGCTIFDTEAYDVHIPLAKLEETQIPKTDLRGSFTQWPPMEDHDEILHLGFLLPALDLISFINFSSDKLMAPYVNAHIYKDVRVPGNLVIPSQEEKLLGFIPVYVSKPDFRMPFLSGSTQNLIALSGEVPFSPIAKGFLYKKPLLEILNQVSIARFGMLRNYQIPSSTTTLDIPLSQSLDVKFQISLENSPEGKDIIYISMGALDEARSSLIPFDFKMTARNEKTKSAELKSVHSLLELSAFSKEIMVFAADLSPQSKDSASTGAIKNVDDLNTSIKFGAFLGLNDLSYAQSSFSHTLKTNQKDAVASHLNLSFLSIDIPGSSEEKGKSRVWWTVITPPSRSKFTLPVLPEGLSTLPTLAPQEELRWVLNRFALEGNPAFSYHDLDDKFLSKYLTHFSWNQITIAKGKQ